MSAYKPKLDDFDLELLGSVETNVEKAIVEYEIPFADGGILDDMGVKARRFQLKTIWRRQNYESHRKFVDYAAIEQLNTLIHPRFGLIRGRIKSVNTVHVDPKSAEISIEFVEDKNPDAAPAYNPPLETSLEDGFNKVTAVMVETCAAELGGTGIDAAIEVDPDQPLAGQISGRTVSARALIAKMEQSIINLRRSFENILNPIESAVGMFNYGASLPGVIIGSVARSIERAAAVVGSATSTPNMFIQSLQNNINRLCVAVPALSSQIIIMGASVGALLAGKIIARDESQKAVLRRIEDAPQLRPDGTPVNTPAIQKILSANELDEFLVRIRKMLAEGVDAARGMDCVLAVFQLAKQMDDITRYINTVKLERDRIVTVEIENAIPLHLVCLRYGLPYTYADRIASINKFWNPTFCVGEMRIYARRG